MTLKKCWITKQSNARIKQLAIHHYVLQKYILTNIIATRHKYLNETNTKIIKFGFNVPEIY